jgi:hypothetical protein
MTDLQFEKSAADILLIRPLLLYLNMQRTKWTDRKFNHDLPEGWLPNVLERLRGTEARIHALIDALSDSQLSFKPEGQWSIKEHIGHLIDLEELHEGRIDDFITGKETLRPADMTNKKTERADHNQKSIQQLIRDFRIKRSEFISRLEKLDDKTQRARAMHPRLQMIMKPVDMAFFTAEHDDHHLATIREIVRTI